MICDKIGVEQLRRRALSTIFVVIRVLIDSGIERAPETIEPREENNSGIERAPETVKPREENNSLKALVGYIVISLVVSGVVIAVFLIIFSMLHDHVGA